MKTSWSLHSSTDRDCGLQMKGRKVTENGEDLDLSGKVFAPGLGAQPGQVEEAGSESGKVLRWVVTQRMFQRRGLGRPSRSKLGFTPGPRREVWGVQVLPGQDSSHHFSKAP